MNAHLPILQVVLPLIAAPACLIINRPAPAWLFTLTVSFCTLAISVLLLLQVTADGVISYALGGWDAPWGIEYRIDILSAYLLLIVSAINAFALLPAYHAGIRELGDQQQTYFYALYLLCLAGLLGILATGDVFNLFVFLEISSLSTYALIALGRDRRALWAAFQYLIIGTIGASFILIGIGFLYALTGTLNMVDLAERLPSPAENRATFAALAFIVVGIGMKIALFPLHAWLPNAYAYAPSVVTVFIAATATKVAIYILIRFFFTVFPHDATLITQVLHKAFTLLGLLSLFAASLTAIYQTNIKRLFAYSSIAQVGYMVVGLGIGTAAGLQATLLHMFNHALIKSALFLALAALVYRLGEASIDTFTGLGRRMPWTTCAVIIGCASLVGMPLTAGFVSKWHLVLSAIAAGQWLVAALVVAGSLLAVVYTWRLIETAYLQPAKQPAPAAAAAAPGEAPLSFILPTWTLILANLYFGIDTRLTVSISAMASQYLFGP